MKTLFFMIILIVAQQTGLFAQSYQSRKIETAPVQNSLRDKIHHLFPEKSPFYGIKRLNINEPAVYLPDTVIIYSTKSYLDASVSIVAAREINAYDSNGNLSGQLLEEFTNSVWNSVVRFTLSYNSQGNKVSVFYEIRSGNGWINEGRGTSTYNTNGYLINEVFEFWTNNAWVNDERTTYTYDSSGNRLTWLSEIWLNNAWINNYRHTYTYGTTGNQLTHITENWTVNVWVNQVKDTFTYDSSGNVLTDLIQSWIDNSWDAGITITYTYDSRGNILTSSSLYLNERHTYTYDMNGNLLIKISEELVGGIWTNKHKQTASYDEFGNQLTGEFFTWDTLANNWGQTETETFKIKVKGEWYYTQYSGIRATIHWIAFMNPVLSVSANTLMIGASAGSTKTFDITSNIGWTTASSQSWLTLSSASGLGNATITLTATANLSQAARTAIITVSGTGVSTRTITVTQDAATPVLTVSTNTLSIGALAGSTKTFDITSNISWITASGQNWLTLSSASGSGNATITLTATANLTQAARTATITVSGTGVAARTITVTQDAASPVLTVSTNTLSIGAPDGSTKTFDITSNISWTTASGQSWLTLSSASGSGNATITLTASANPTIISRMATVTITGSGVSTQTITVIQEGTTGVSDLAANEFTIYPNPAQDILFFNAKVGNVLVLVYDLTGKMVLCQQISNNQIDISKLPHGIFILKIADATGLVIKKFVKE